MALGTYLLSRITDLEVKVANCEAQAVMHEAAAVRMRWEAECARKTLDYLRKSDSIDARA